jgi:hypothetical protein
MTNHPVLDATVLECFQIRPVTGDVGIEMEIEGTNLPGAISGWEVHEERSLRGEAREYVTRGAVSLGKLRKTLLTAHTALSRADTAVRLTGRASTHIHLNMQQETFRTVFGTILVGTILEPWLLQLCGPVRNGNLFCLPSSETHDLATLMEAVAARVLHYGRAEFSRHAWHARGKYAAINTDPLNTFGTIEFRCFPNSIDPDTIVRWATWVTNIREFARNYPENDYTRLFDDAYRHPELLYGVFDGQGEKQENVVTTPDELIRAGAEVSYEAWKNLKPLFNYTPPEQKKKKKPSIAAPAGWDAGQFERVLVNMEPPQELRFVDEDL